MGKNPGGKSLGHLVLDKDLNSAGFSQLKMQVLAEAAQMLIVLMQDSL